MDIRLLLFMKSWKKKTVDRSEWKGQLLSSLIFFGVDNQFPSLMTMTIFATIVPLSYVNN